MLAGNELMVARIVRFEGAVQAVGRDRLGQDGDQFKLAAGNDLPYRRQQAAVEAAHHANVEFAAEGFFDGVQQLDPVQHRHVEVGQQKVDQLPLHELVERLLPVLGEQDVGEAELPQYSGALVAHAG